MLCGQSGKDRLIEGPTGEKVDLAPIHHIVGVAMVVGLDICEHALDGRCDIRMDT